MSQKEDTIIRFSGLKPGRYTYSYSLTDEFFEEWKNDEIRGGKVEIEAKMERMEHMLMFTFTLKGEVTTMCDRCLGDLVVPVEGEEHLCVRFSDTETEHIFGSNLHNIAGFLLTGGVLPQDACEASWRNY